MSKEKVYMEPNPTAPRQPVEFDEKVCNGCNMCVEVCPMDVLMPYPEKGKPPIVLYPDECWHCANCCEACTRFERGAIKFKHPIVQRIRWKRKETGGHFRMGMPNPPPPNLRPPVGEKARKTRDKGNVAR